jgi:hypothetical protein
MLSRLRQYAAALSVGQDEAEGEAQSFPLPPELQERGLHPTLPGRDRQGRLLPKPWWDQAPEAIRRGTRGRVFSRTKAHMCRCRVCDAIFEGYRNSRYCSPVCRRKAQVARDRARGIIRQGKTIRVLQKAFSDDQRRMLPLYNRRHDERAYDPAKPWHLQPPPPPGLMVPLSDELEDALARLLEQHRYVIEQRLGKPSSELRYMGAPATVAGFYDRLLHDALLGAIQGLLNEIGARLPQRFRHRGNASDPTIWGHVRDRPCV